MKKLFSILSVISVSACATGEPVGRAAVAPEGVPPGKSRIVVYRTETYGAAIQPKIRVDGEVLSRCVPRGVAFVDVPKGLHKVSATTELQREVTVDTRQEPVAYVRCSIAMGMFTGRPVLEQVPPSTGTSEAAQLSVVEKPG